MRVFFCQFCVFKKILLTFWSGKPTGNRCRWALYLLNEWGGNGEKCEIPYTANCAHLIITIFIQEKTRASGGEGRCILHSFTNWLLMPTTHPSIQSSQHQNGRRGECGWPIRGMGRGGNRNGEKVAQTIFTPIILFARPIFP
jgi:hypothetical protein